MEIQGLMQYQFTASIGYPVTPSFFSQKSPILEKLLSQYPKYNLQDEAIIVYTKDPGFQVVITPQNLTLVQNSKINNLDPLNELKFVWQIISKKLKVSDISSISFIAEYIKKMSLQEAFIQSNKFVNSKIMDLLDIDAEQAQISINYDENKRKSLLKIMPGVVQNFVFNIGPNQNATQQSVQDSMEGLIVSINTISNDVLPFRFSSEISEIYQSINSKIGIIEKGDF